MSNIAILYKSKYSSTKKYAEWIAQGTKADLLPCKMLIRIEDNKTYIGRQIQKQ